MHHPRGETRLGETADVWPRPSTKFRTGDPKVAHVAACRGEPSALTSAAPRPTSNPTILPGDRLFVVDEELRDTPD